METQCTSRCRSLVHAGQVLSAITKGGQEEQHVVISYLQWLCSNHVQLTDNFGRSALHLAASCGKIDIVRWLLSNKSCKINARDWESGWTPLHRSLFYGQLHTASILIENGASLSTLDHDSCAPMNLVISDRPSYVDYKSAGINEVYVWGTNNNYNLGGSQSRSLPESLDTFRKVNVNIEQVVMRKFHTLFLSREGRVYVCGHGTRGRLGVPVEKTLLKPQLVRSISKEVCVQIAAGTNHNVLLMASGSVWTCGSNENHQLGHVPPPESLSTPRMINGMKNMSGNVVGVCAERFHSVICLKNVLYTFGLNAGQLGHPEQGEHHQTAPRVVTALTKQNIEFVHIAASIAATVCATKSGDLFVLHEYQCRKIASKQNDILKLSVCGGTLGSKVAPTLIKDGGGTKLRILILTENGRMLLWSETYPHLSACLYSVNRPLQVIDAQLFADGVLFATITGEGFIATVTPPKGKKQENDLRGAKANVVSNFNEWLEKDECFQLKLKLLPDIHRAVSVACDHKGRNFAVIQAHPKASLVEIPQPLSMELESDMKRLLMETELEDGIQDCTLKVGKAEFPAHRFVLSSRCEFLCEMIAKSRGVCVKADKIHSSIVPDVLEFLYTDSCRFLMAGEIISHCFGSSGENDRTPDVIASTMNKKNSKKTDSSELNALRLMRDAARILNLSTLESSPNFSDVSITSQDGAVFKCHKCILVARSDYFHGMLAGSVWRETSSSFPLPIPGAILENVLDCLYTNEAPKLSTSDDVEFICNNLVTADSLLISILKELCEVKLAELLTLKNAMELLEISWIYNASQLKASTMQFIGLNLTAMLEMKCLSSLSDEILIELTKSYRQLIPQMCYRAVTPYEAPPTLEEMRFVHETHSARLANGRAEPIKEKKKSRTPKKTFFKKGEVKTVHSLEPELPKTSANPPESESVPEENAQLVASPTSDSPLASVSESLISSTPQTPTWLDGDELNDAFPDLLCELKTGNSADKTRSFNDSFRRRGKLSQKQRKQLQSAPIPIPNSDLIENVPKPNPWGKVAPKTPEQPFSDIIQVQLASKTSHLRKQQIRNEPGAGFLVRESQSRWDNNSEVSVSPQSPRTSKAGMKSPTVVDNTSFADILVEEKQQADYAARWQSKPLHLIQMEDQAIEDLLRYYKAEFNPEEAVSVTRVLPKVTATPTWKPHRS